MGQPGQGVPEMSDEFVNSVSERYIELYEKLIGDKFYPVEDNQEMLHQNILNGLAKLP